MTVLAIFQKCHHKVKRIYIFLLVNESLFAFNADCFSSNICYVCYRCCHHCPLPINLQNPPLLPSGLCNLDVTISFFIKNLFFHYIANQSQMHRTVFLPTLSSASYIRLPCAAVLHRRDFFLKTASESTSLHW